MYRKFSCMAFAAGLLCTLIVMRACKPGGDNKTETVTRDHEFGALFYSDSGGITGADGLFSILLPDSSSLFLLGDCFLGEVRDGARDLNTPMLRNAFNLVSKERTGAIPIIRGTAYNPQTLMEPVNEPGDSTYRWYWPGHGFIKNDTVYIFALSLVNDTSDIVNMEFTDDADDKTADMAKKIFSFRVSHIDLLSFSYPDFRHLETHRADICYSENRIDFGNCVLVDEGWIYIYGTGNMTDTSKVYVARIPFYSNVFESDWEYFTGDSWDSNVRKSMPINIDMSVSEQFSIFRYRKKYILLTQERAGADVYTYISDFAYKGFHNRKLIYHTTEMESDTSKHVITYNALAHPQYTENNRLLVSYCVNSLNPDDIFEDVEKYRARFLRVPMKLICTPAGW